MKSLLTPTLPGLLVLAILSASEPLLAIDYTWNGGSGQWTESAKWTPNGIPSSGDKATINGGTVNIPQEGAGIAELILTGGIIEGPGDLTVATAMDWHAGADLRGTGTTTIAPAATLTFEGDGNRGLHNRTLQINGTFLVDAEGTFWLQSGAIVHAGSPAVIELRADSVWNHNYGTGPTVTLAGSLSKTAGGGSASFSNFIPNLDNLSVECSSGSLVFPSGVTGNGSFHAGTGARITFPTNTSLVDSSFTGAGVVEFTGGELYLDGSFTSENVELHGATLYGTHILQGEWKWLSNDLRGDGLTTIGTGATLRLQGTGDRAIHNRTLQVNGSFIDEGTGTLWLQSGCSVQTGLNGTITLPGSLSWNHNYGTSPTVTNLGTIEKTGGGAVNL